MYFNPSTHLGEKPSISTAWDEFLLLSTSGYCRGEALGIRFVVFTGPHWGQLVLSSPNFTCFYIIKLFLRCIARAGPKGSGLGRVHCICLKKAREGRWGEGGGGR